MTASAFADSQYYQVKNILLANFLLSQHSRMKFSFSLIHLLPSSKSGKKFKVKDHISPHLSQINSLLIEIYLRAIHYLGITSIFSQGNSSNKLNFCNFFKVAKKFILKEINYGETSHFANSPPNLLTRTLILSSSSLHALCASFIEPSENCITFTSPYLICVRKSHLFERKKFSTFTRKSVLSCLPPNASSSFHCNFNEETMPKANSTILHAIERNIRFA